MRRKGRTRGRCDCFVAKRLLTSGLKFRTPSSTNLEVAECLPERVGTPRVATLDVVQKNLQKVEREEMTTKAPLVVIVGGGFGGLAAAKGIGCYLV
jgi:hypothetical protein